MPCRGVDEPGEDGADGVQWTRCHRAPRLLSDQCQVGQAVAGDAAPAELFGHQQAGPAEFGGALPPLRLEGSARGVQFPDMGQRGLFLEEPSCRGGEQHLFRVGGVGHGC